MKTDDKNTENKNQNGKDEFAEALGMAQLLAQLLTPPKREAQQISTTNIHVTITIHPDGKSMFQKLFGWLKRK